jgi:hypothetical protein
MPTEVQGRSRWAWIVAASLVGGAALAGLGWGWTMGNERFVVAVTIGALLIPMLVGVALVVGMVLWEKWNPPEFLPANDPHMNREAHLDALRDGLRRANQPIARAYRSRIRQQVDAYIRSRTGRRQDDRDEGPLLFVVEPEEGDPYWIRCNRLIEAEKYCRRQHADTFKIAPWTLPEPAWSQVRLVDLIG